MINADQASALLEGMKSDRYRSLHMKGDDGSKFWYELSRRGDSGSVRRYSSGGNFTSGTRFEDMQDMLQDIIVSIRAGFDKYEPLVIDGGERGIQRFL